MDYQTVLEAAIISVTFMISFGWFFWQRYQSLERRFKALEEKHQEARIARDGISHELQLFRLAHQSNHESHQYLIASNTQLIEHRTKRFAGYLKAIEARLSADIKEMKQWLDAHTEFKIREP
ncbi:MAG: hypothetical protein AAF609_24865 [Cyanobacteria bacterium P01_C01_bin.120]